MPTGWFLRLRPIDMFMWANQIGGANSAPPFSLLALLLYHGVIAVVSPRTGAVAHLIRSAK
jgi:hypothetical protein